MYAYSCLPIITSGVDSARPPVQAWKVGNCVVSDFNSLLYTQELQRGLSTNTTVHTIIDNIDYVNGIGNRSREP